MNGRYLLILISFLCLTTALYAQKPEIQSDHYELFAGPKSPPERDSWYSVMLRWRENEKKEIGYHDSAYSTPQTGWSEYAFINVQMLVWDRFFYNPVTARYTVKKFLDDLSRRYGGIDAVLIWPTYPNMGIDDRNQFDLLYDMPGGKEGIRQMIADFHKQGVRVFFPIMIWDHGTREISRSMANALVAEMKELGVDGLNGDTMKGVTEDFKQASDSLDYPLVLQPETYLRDLKMIEWNQMSWGYFYYPYTYIPGVSIYKWFEPRHQVNVTNRWDVDKTDDLQYAFFNGVGYNPWENIWGTWNQIPERYEEVIRRISTIYRQFPGIWSSAKWEPFSPVSQEGVFASKFPGIDKTIYNFVNRDSTDKYGIQIQLPYKPGMRYFDLWNGEELNPRINNDSVNLNFLMEKQGYGSVLAAKEYALKEDFFPFLEKIRQMAQVPLKDISASWEPLSQHIVPIPRTRAAVDAPKGMILIKGTADYVFESKGTMIEGDPLPAAVGIQYPWEIHPARATRHRLDIPSFYIDKYPVTHKQFKIFMDSTHYHPRDDHSFLRDWKSGTYPEGWGNKPVTWVSLEDARAYAAWAGKRLPHEWEWQYAAQGNDGRLYPWGNQMDSSRIPPVDNSRSMRPPTDVDAFPAGASSLGVLDMVGNVWNWTDEYRDEHTRAAVLKGGGYYRPSKSGWYFRRAYELNKYGKYLLMAPGIDRSAAIGFRCVRDK